MQVVAINITYKYALYYTKWKNLITVDHAYRKEAYTKSTSQFAVINQIEDPNPH